MSNKNSIKPAVKNRVSLKRVALFSTILSVVILVVWKFLAISTAVVYPTGVFGQFTPSNGPTVANFGWETTLTIDHTKVMDSVNLIDFPLLVVLHESALKTVSNGGNVESNHGYDILFCGANDAKLEHQVESYNPVTGELTAWVKLPVLFNNVDTEIKITCGNNSINTNSSTENVWNSEYEAVWHMNDNPSATDLQDAAGTFNGQSFGNMTGSDLVVGKIAGAIDFDGNDDYFAIENKSYTNPGEVNTLTVSAWVKTDFNNNSWTSNWSLIDFDRSEYFNFFVHGKGYISFCTRANGIDDFHGGAQGQVNNNEWHHVVAVFDGQAKKLFIDGVLVGTVNNPHGGQPIGSGTNRFGFIGEGSEAGSYNGSRNNLYYKGKIDELRLIEAVKSDGWIMTEYFNQSNPSAFYSIGNPIDLPIELVEFDAKLKDEIVHVTWATASERDNDFFTIERSLDGNDFEIVGIVKGSGTTTEYREFEFFDENPFEGLSYYRLKQTDTNGEFETFNAVSINYISPANSFEISRVWPNPFTKKFDVIFQTNKDSDIQITLIDMNGTTRFTDVIYAREGENSYTFYDSGDLVRGMYFLNAVSNDRIIGSTKIIKQ